MPQRSGFGALQETEEDVVTGSLSLFHHEEIDGIIRERKSCIAKPSSGIQGNGPFEIFINSERQSYIDPSSFRVHAKIKIRRYNNNRELIDIPQVAENAPMDVFPVNLFSKCIFKDVEVELENHKISLNASNTYPIKTYLTTLASYGGDATRNHLRCSYHLKDTAGQADNFALNVNGRNRHVYIARSKMVYISDDIHTELTSCNRHIVPGVSVKFRFIIENPNLFLIHAPGANAQAVIPEHIIEFHDFYLTYDRVILNESRGSAIEKKITSTPAIYPIVRTEIRTKGFAPGLSSIEWNNAYQGVLPETVLVCMNLQRAADGQNTANIFNFQHFSMKEISLLVNSQRIPALPLQFDFANGEGIEGYRHFFDNIGISISNSPSLINYDEFIAGSTIIPFDLTSDRCSLWHKHEKKEGNISIDIKLQNELANAINVYCICIYSDNFYIYGPVDARKVSLTYPEKI
jgi:hypothetical protein